MVIRILLGPEGPSYRHSYRFRAPEAEVRSYGKNNIACRRKRFAVQTKRFPDDPFNPVTPDRPSHFPMHTDTQPIVRLLIGQKNQGKTFAPDAFSPPVYFFKLPILAKQTFFREPKPFHTTPQADKRLRPLARLLLITAWPDLVLMRNLKP